MCILPFSFIGRDAKCVGIATNKVLCSGTDNYSLDLLFNQQKHHSLLQLEVMRNKIFILNKSDKAAMVQP